MSHSESNIDIVYIGRYNSGDDATGPEKAARNIFYEGSKKNNAIFIEYFFDGRRYSFFKKLFGKETALINNNVKVFRLGLLRIIPKLIKFKPIILHLVTYERFAVTALLYKLFSNVKFIYNIHGIIIYENSELKNLNLFYKWKDKVCEKLFLKHSDGLIFASHQALDKANKHYNIDENKVSIIPHGIEDNSNQRIINKIFTAIIISNKIGFSKTTEFFNKILEKINTELELNVIGDSTNIIKNTKVKVISHHLLTGKKFKELLSKTDIFFSINQYDTFSISTLEAMASGCCVIVTNETGISSYIKNGINGFSVDYGETDSVIDIIDRLNNDTKLRNDISDEARKITDELNWESIYKKYSLVYENL